MLGDRAPAGDQEMDERAVPIVPKVASWQRGQQAWHVLGANGVRIAQHIPRECGPGDSDPARPTLRHVRTARNRAARSAPGRASSAWGGRLRAQSDTAEAARGRWPRVGPGFGDRHRGTRRTWRDPAGTRARWSPADSVRPGAIRGTPRPAREAGHGVRERADQVMMIWP